MKDFAASKGIKLNGIFYPRADLLPLSNKEGLSDFELEVLDFASKLLDDKAKIKVETSGSTGKPKVIKFAKSAFAVSARATNTHFSLHSESTALLALPMRYIAGKMMVARAILGGYNLLAIEPDGTPLKNIANTRIDFMPLTPYQALKSAEETPASLRNVGAVLIGGAQVSEALQARLSSLGVKAYVSFGMTETLSHFAIATLDKNPEIKYAPLKGVSLKTKKNGQLSVKWKGITDGWLSTNDLVDLHDEGFVWLGRGDHLINSGGIKVIPEMVEKRLAHLIHGNFFVAGIPHKRLGEEVALFVETRNSPYPVSLTDVQHALSDTPFWQPRKIVDVERFLYTASGKVKRKEVVKKVISSEQWKAVKK
jgi:O-succinylbenzoic acid--CoA ligase